MKKSIIQKRSFFFLALYFSDVLMFIGSMTLSSWLFNPTHNSEFDFYIRLLFFSLLIMIVNYSAFGLYDEKRNLFDENQVMSLFYSMTITYALMLAFIIIFGIKKMVFYLSIGFIASFIFTLLLRFLLYRLIYFYRRLGYDQQRVLFYGKNSTELMERIKDNKLLGYKIIGMTSSLSELKESISKEKADVVFITEEHLTDGLIKIIFENNQITWKVVPSAFNLIMDQVNFDEFKDYPVINIPSSSKSQSYLQVKRLFDIVLTVIALLFLWPLFLFIILMMKLTMPGPIFYMQERIGKDYKPFLCYKFRTMIVGADKVKTKLKSETQILFKMKKDPRVTWFGNILRRTGIDELPQLFNILKGDMSIVGPRPHIRAEIEFYKGWRKLRFKVQPGLTGMWQVSGRHELNFDKAVLYDIYYVKHMSLILDISIIIKTIPSIIFSRGRY
ncbi:exopolysaccharide biosynthesis polyprenyl glycosylphosphotransferase [Candidatus Woesearchaeota archaeon]|nr:exopolysaccharide biosynthesis polyprenyl glycosylphosphotransferase [Candidatus Woesearchaeota archaeon]